MEGGEIGRYYTRSVAPLIAWLTSGAMPFGDCALRTPPAGWLCAPYLRLGSMRPLLSALLGASILSGSISYHIATNHFEIVTPLTEWFLRRNSFTFLFYIASASIGVVFMTAGRRGSEVDEHIRKHGDSIATFYASAGGSIFGWATGICIAAVLANPVRYWLFATQVSFMSAFVVAAPLVGMMFTRQPA